MNRILGRYRKYFIITVLLVFFVCSCVTAFGATKDTGQSSFDYKKYEQPSQYRRALKNRMKDVSKRLSPKMDDESTIPIPGLVETKIYTSDGIGTSDNYIPQGICSTGDYWLITAYDAGKKNLSVIYAVDPKEKSIVSTVSIPNKFHVGGIAFDGKRIWLTGNTSDKYQGKPFLQYIDYDAFLGMIKSNLYKMSKKEISPKVYIKNKPSYLEYDNGKLWVGTYIGTKDTKDAYMYGYPVVENEDGSAALNTILFSVITGIDSSTQGVDIDGDDLYVSSSYKGTSYAVKSSFVTRYDISPVNNGKGILYVKNREKKRVEVPKMNEEIIVENGKVYINFESGANRWKYAVINTDRVLAVDSSLWGK